MILYYDLGARVDGHCGVIEEPRAEWTKARGLLLVNRDLMHLVGEDLRLQLGVFIAQGRKRLAHFHQSPLLLPFEVFLFLLKAPILVHVGAHAEEHVPTRACSLDQLIKGLWWGVAGGEDARRYDGDEGIVGEVQPPSQLHLAQVFVDSLLRAKSSILSEISMAVRS